MNYQSKLQGLTDSQVMENRNKYGKNILSPPKRKPVWKLFLEKFNDPIIRILLIAAFLSLGISIIHNEYAETIGIFCAIFLATGISFWFELDANRKFDILNQVNDDTLVKVIRNGKIEEIPKQDVVVGDIVILQTGDEVPADGELIEAISLQVNESALTGEPIISKTTNENEYEKDATYPSNWVMRGTSVMDGHGFFEVKKTGDSTEYGKVAEKSTEITEEKTPLNIQLEGLANFIGFVGLILSGLTFGILFFRDIIDNNNEYTHGQLWLLSAIIIGAVVALVKVWLPLIYGGFEVFGKEKELPAIVKKGSWFIWISAGTVIFLLLAGLGSLGGINPLERSSWISVELANHVLQYFMISVTLIVVAVPEGLPMSITLSLALSMRKMLKTNNLVRKMHACETMGAVTVICTDKTGTLTKNQMRVAETYFSGLDNQQLSDSENSQLIKENIAVNSTAFLDFSNPTQIRTLGNPTEAALLLWLNENGVDYRKIREETEIIQQLTFSTERKYMATLVKSPSSHKYILYVKGAPEIVLAKSASILKEGKYLPVNEEKENISQQLLKYQNQAMRTLGFAYKVIESENIHANIEELARHNLIYSGITAISDPVREDVPQAVQECLNAGIKVKIVTGDTPGTAKEIGRQIGIWKQEDSENNIITGTDFEALPDNEAQNRVNELKIMCRARPTDKQRLVHLLQKNKEIVAVTGDGTNDAPALNYAQVGLSMGTGTSVAKEASDITLLDDSFNSIATAVMWGRSLYKNIQRFIIFQLTINVTAIILVFLGSIFGQGFLPLTVTQMLWINLIMDTFAAAALASLPPDERVMREKPRKNDAFIVSPAMRRNILFTGLSFVIILLGMLFCISQPEIMEAKFSYIPAESRELYALSFFFTTFVVLQFWNMFNAKAFQTGKSAFHNLRNSQGFILIAVLILAGQFLIVEFGGEVFRTTPLFPNDWLIILGGTSLVLWIGESMRLLKKKN